MPIYLQAYLNMAYDRTRALKNEVGKISNIDLQKNVSIGRFDFVFNNLE